jgi:hypothetical protein
MLFCPEWEGDEMRVVIEIHDGEVTAAMPQPRIAAAATGLPTPPPEILAAAAAVGAMNAGPAPTEAMAPGTPVAPTPTVALPPAAGEAADLAAGAAPGDTTNP